MSPLSSHVSLSTQTPPGGPSLDVAVQSFENRISSIMQNSIGQDAKQVNAGEAALEAEAVDIFASLGCSMEAVPAEVFFNQASGEVKVFERNATPESLKEEVEGSKEDGEKGGKEIRKWKGIYDRGRVILSHEDDKEFRATVNNHIPINFYGNNGQVQRNVVLGPAIEARQMEAFERAYVVYHTAKNIFAQFKEANKTQTSNPELQVQMNGKAESSAKSSKVDLSLLIKEMLAAHTIRQIDIERATIEKDSEKRAQERRDHEAEFNNAVLMKHIKLQKFIDRKRLESDQLQADLKNTSISEEGRVDNKTELLSFPREGNKVTVEKNGKTRSIKVFKGIMDNRADGKDKKSP